MAEEAENTATATETETTNEEPDSNEEQTGSTKPVKSFNDYGWDEDEEWQILIKKLEFPPSFDDTKKQKYIDKRKQRYFKENVDPSFTPVTTNQQQQPPKPDTSSAASPSPPPEIESSPPPQTTSASTGTSSSASSKPAPQTSTKPPPTTSSSSSSSSANNNQRSNYGSYQPPPSAIGRMLSPFLNYFYALSQWFVFVCCLLSFASGSFYFRALYAVILMHLVAAVQNNGKPQFAMWYVQRMFQDENIMIAVYAAIFLMTNPFFVFLAPVALRSFYMGTWLLSGLTRSTIPSLHARCKPMFDRVLHQTAWYNQTVALLEVLMGVFLIFCCFFLARTVILTFIYWQIMHARYMMSSMIQVAFRTVHLRMQSLLGRVSFLLSLYMKLAGFLSNMVDPQRIQEQAQSGGGGGIAGMMKKCCIM